EAVGLENWDQLTELFELLETRYQAGVLVVADEGEDEGLRHSALFQKATTVMQTVAQATHLELHCLVQQEAPKFPPYRIDWLMPPSSLLSEGEEPGSDSPSAILKLRPVTASVPSEGGQERPELKVGCDSAASNTLGGVAADPLVTPPGGARPTFVTGGATP